MKRTLILASVTLAVVAVATLGMSPQARADSWIFGPSYYAGTVPETHPAQRRPTRGPFYSRPQGEYINSGYRYQRNTINVQGRVLDQYNIFESWVQVGGAF